MTVLRQVLRLERVVVHYTHRLRRRQTQGLLIQLSEAMA